jgi:hypothetical protein
MQRRTVPISQVTSSGVRSESFSKRVSTEHEGFSGKQGMTSGKESCMRRDGSQGKSIFPDLVLGILLVLSGCSAATSEDASRAGPDSTILDLSGLYTNVNSIAIRVIYEPDAVPSTGTTGNGVQYWSVLEDNMRSLFQGRAIEPEIIVPYDLADMEQIPEQGRTSWTKDQILGLARSMGNSSLEPSAAEFHVLFLNGYFNENNTINISTVGVSIGGTTVVAVFKDVIASSGYSPILTAIMEQATLVHELAHTLGLVDNGVPVSSDHEDPDHAHHCMNEACLMYWNNEQDDLAVFVKQILNSGIVIMFCQECLQDTRSYAP